MSLASHQGPGYHNSAVSAGLITLFHSHHFPRGCAPPHAPDTKSYVIAYLEGYIALGWWSESAFFRLTEQESVGWGLEEKDLSVETSHFPSEYWHFYKRRAGEALQRHKLFNTDVLV